MTIEINDMTRDLLKINAVNNSDMKTALAYMEFRIKRLRFNVSHDHDKDQLTYEHVATLADAKFFDNSWGNNECSSFLSPCEKYEIFVGFDDENETIFVVKFEDEDDIEWLSNGATDDISVAMSAIESHQTKVAKGEIA